MASLDELPAARAVLFDLTPRQVLAVAGDRLSPGYRRQLEGFRYGPGVHKVDWALDGPIPWRDARTLRAGTVHLGGTMREVARLGGRRPSRPHRGSPVRPARPADHRRPDARPRRQARRLGVLPRAQRLDRATRPRRSRHRSSGSRPGSGTSSSPGPCTDAAAMEAYDANYVGGDINGGVQDVRQLLFRPVVRWNPYTTLGSRPVPVLVVHAAGRRRPWHERRARRARGGAMAGAAVGRRRPRATWRFRAVMSGLLAAILFAASLFIVAPAGIILLVAYAGTGLVLAARRPRQPIAWLLVLIGVGLALGNVIVSGSMVAIIAGTTTPFESFTVWANGSGWGIAFACLVALAFVFPSGSLPTNRTRPVAVAWLAMSIACAVLIAVAPVVNITPSGSAFGIDVPNPYAILPGSVVWSVIPEAGSLFTFLFVLVATSLLALFVRFRRSSGLERLQYRWLVWSIGVVTLGTVVWAIATFALRVDQAQLFVIPLVIAYPCVPIAVVIAVLRYRLYEIDRLVSRTLGWGLATTTVLALFVVAVLALQAALAGLVQGQVLAVAGSTLLAFAVFQPVRARVQSFVDRRFDRPRLEAERSLAAYGERLQREVDLPTVTRDVEETAVAALRPSAIALWIRPSRPTRP